MNFNEKKKKIEYILKILVRYSNNFKNIVRVVLEKISI